MRNFIKYVLLFSLPLFIVGMASEYLLRKIPNEYVLKKNFLDNHSDSIKTLFLGSSHAYYAINPANFSESSFNASHISQTLDYDFEILKHYRNHWDNLECIVIPVSYFSLFDKLEAAPECWRVKNYNIYYGMNTTHRITDYSEFLGNKLEVNWRKIYAYYFKKNPYVNCSNLGWGLNYSSKDKRDLSVTGEMAARRHTKRDDKFFAKNVDALKSIIEFAQKEGVKVLLYTPPAFHTYVENLNTAQLNKTLNAAISIDASFTNVTYVNFLFDTSFSAADFFDADHLNEIGAGKLTKKIDAIVNGNSRQPIATNFK